MAQVGLSQLDWLRRLVDLTQFTVCGLQLDKIMKRAKFLLKRLFGKTDEPIEIVVETNTGDKKELTFEERLSTLQWCLESAKNQFQLC